MGVSVVGVFLAGLVSFLSPCVLPLVPGYISMLSGIGVEQLRQGQTPRNHLMSSAIAFVLGFSVVFIAFGASASAVGSFLTHHRSLMVPIAGAVVILSGFSSSASWSVSSGSSDLCSPQFSSASESLCKRIPAYWAIPSVRFSSIPSHSSHYSVLRSPSGCPATFTSEISVALTQKKKLARSLESSADS